MENGEFEKIWRLMGILWPNAAAKKSEVDKAVWRKALAGYTMQSVSDRIMAYAKGNKFFPDLADVTKGLNAIRVTASAAEAAVLHNIRVYAKFKGVKAPEFDSAADAMAWFREMEAGA